MIKDFFNVPQYYFMAMECGRRLLEKENDDHECKTVEHQLNTRIYNNAFCGLLRAGCRYAIEQDTDGNPFMIRIDADGISYRCPYSSAANILRNEFQAVLDGQTETEVTTSETAVTSTKSPETKIVSSPSKGTEKEQKAKEQSGALKNKPAKQEHNQAKKKPDGNQPKNVPVVSGNSGAAKKAPTNPVPDLSAKEKKKDVVIPVAAPKAAENAASLDEVDLKIREVSARKMPDLNGMFGVTMGQPLTKKAEVPNLDLSSKPVSERKQVSAPVMEVGAETDKNDEAIQVYPKIDKSERTEPDDLRPVFPPNNREEKKAEPAAELQHIKEPQERGPEVNIPKKEVHEAVAHPTDIPDLNERQDSNSESKPEPPASEEGSSFDSYMEPELEEDAFLPKNMAKSLNEAEANNDRAEKAEDGDSADDFNFLPKHSVTDNGKKTEERSEDEERPKEKRGGLFGLFGGRKNREESEHKNKHVEDVIPEFQPNRTEAAREDRKSEAFEPRREENIRQAAEPAVTNKEPEAIKGKAVPTSNIPDLSEPVIQDIPSKPAFAHGQDGGELFQHIHTVTLKPKFGDAVLSQARFYIWPTRIIEMHPGQVFADILVHVTDKEGVECVRCSEGNNKQISIVTSDKKEFNVYGIWDNGSFTSYVTLAGRTESQNRMEEECVKNVPEHAVTDAFLDQFRFERKGQPSHFVVPFKDRNCGEQNIPIIGYVAANGRKYPLERREGNMLRYRYNANDKVIRGHWENGKFCFELEDATNIDWGEESEE